MAKVAGYEIKFITPDKRLGRVVVGEPDEQKATSDLKAKYGEVNIKSCRPLDAKTLRDQHIETDGSIEWISQNVISDPDDPK
jgi:hypothetical protein